jgi:pantetheine-phosphate adenylyltransferase
VAVSLDPRKKALFTVEERVKMITQELSRFPNVEVGCFNGLLVEFTKQKNARVIVRGLRAVSDFETEFQIALMNRSLNPEVETVFLVAQPQFSYLSSSMVKEVASLKGDISGLVSEHVARNLQEQFALHERQ